MPYRADTEPITYTEKIGIILKDAMGDDRRICDAARVSTLGDGADQAVKSISDDGKLIRFLMRDKHGSPFEHGAMTFIVTAPIFVFWDHVRHRIGVSYNIESSRYRELRPVFYQAPQARVQSGKPGHYVMSPGTDDQTQIMREARLDANAVAWGAYQDQLDAGIAREQAMEVLPMNTVISAYVTFNPRSLMKFLELRLGPARKELQILAAGYAEHMAARWPATHCAFEEFGRVAP